MTFANLMMRAAVPSQANTLAKLKRAAANAVNNNPVDLADMATPPTMTQNATHDVSLTVQADHFYQPRQFRVSHGHRYDRFGAPLSTEFHLGSANVGNGPGVGNMNAFQAFLYPVPPNTGENELASTVTFVTSAPVVEIQQRTNTSVFPDRIIVNNQFVARDGYTASQPFTRLDFGAPGLKTITYEGATAFMSVAVSAGYTITAPTDEIVKVSGTGDSIMESTSSGDTNLYCIDAWVSTFAKQAGLNSCRNTAVGLTGYWNIGGTRLNIQQQMAYWAAEDVHDLIVFDGGFNDYNNTTTANMQTAALAAWQLARSTNPNALIIVTGIPPEATGPSASLIAGENALLSTFNTWADQFSKFINLSSGTPMWTGTGYVAHTNGTDQTNTLVSSDGVHPSRAGRIFFGNYINTKYRALLAAM